MADRETRTRVLCVDDEPQVLAGLVDVLRRRFDVTCAASGRHAFSLLSQEPHFTVIVADYLMPEMTGAEFLSLARTVVPDSVRILLTGHASVDTAIAAVNDGNIFRLLTKPCAPPDLMRALDDAVEQSRLLTADRELLERKLESMAQHLVRAERFVSVGTMAGAIGHELANAVDRLGSALDCMRANLDCGMMPDAGQIAMLAEARERLALHANHLLRVGAPASSHTHTNLSRTVGELMVALRHAGITNQIAIDLDLPLEPVTIPVSRAEIEQIVVNLVKNAVEALAAYQPPQPSVRISVAPAPSSPHMMVCTVSDNAAGIPAAKLPLVFEPYYSTKPPERGAGLGLFAVRQIVRRAGGEITVESVEGSGTTFRIVLPRLAERVERDRLSLAG